MSSYYQTSCITRTIASCKLPVASCQLCVGSCILGHRIVACRGGSKEGCWKILLCMLNAWGGKRVVPRVKFMHIHMLNAFQGEGRPRLPHGHRLCRMPVHTRRCNVSPPSPSSLGQLIEIHEKSSKARINFGQRKKCAKGMRKEIWKWNCWKIAKATATAMAMALALAMTICRRASRTIKRIKWAGKCIRLGRQSSFSSSLPLSLYLPLSFGEQLMAKSCTYCTSSGAPKIC